MLSAKMTAAQGWVEGCASCHSEDKVHTGDQSNQTNFLARDAWAAESNTSRVDHNFRLNPMAVVSHLSFIHMLATKVWHVKHRGAHVSDERHIRAIYQQMACSERGSWRQDTVAERWQWHVCRTWTAAMLFLLPFRIQSNYTWLFIIPGITVIVQHAIG